jgi:hypothetical protein
MIIEEAYISEKRTYFEVNDNSETVINKRISYSGKL